MREERLLYEEILLLRRHGSQRLRKLSTNLLFILALVLEGGALVGGDPHLGGRRHPIELLKVIGSGLLRVEILRLLVLLMAWESDVWACYCRAVALKLLLVLVLKSQSISAHLHDRVPTLREAVLPLRTTQHCLHL